MIAAAKGERKLGRCGCFSMGHRAAARSCYRLPLARSWALQSAQLLDVRVLRIAELFLSLGDERPRVDRVQKLLLVQRHAGDVDRLEPLLDLCLLPLALVDQQREASGAVLCGTKPDPPPVLLDRTLGRIHLTKLNLLAVCSDKVVSRPRTRGQTHIVDADAVLEIEREQSAFKRAIMQ